MSECGEKENKSLARVRLECGKGKGEGVVKVSA